ncbi:hypothetical protein [Solirubrum puertoriconensis]|nr:hypothetical protein [Solirubrum puertoriconensis]
MILQEGQTSAEGVVVDSVTGQAVGPAQVRLYTRAKRGTSAVLTAADRWRDTDAHGRFAFSFEAKSEYEYVVRATSPRGESNYLTPPQLKGGRKNKGLRVPVDAPAWVRIHLRDEPPRTDAVNIVVGGFQQSFIIRPPKDTVIFRFVPPGDNVVGWQLNGGRTTPAEEHRIRYTVAGMDTARVQIRY